MYSPDDEIVDAEIVEDEPGTDLEIIGSSSGVAERSSSPALRNETGVIDIPLTSAQRMLIREALSHYHDKGPRSRSTAAILITINHLAAFEPSVFCSNCDNTGRVRDMYALSYCHCPRGIQARSDGRGL
jgi:hypothetical protein